MAKQDNIELEGEVIAELGNAMFKVRSNLGDQELLCTISGKLRKNFIRIMVGDTVKLEVSPYDLTRGRIVHRMKIVNNNNVNNNSTNFKKKK